MYIGGKLRVHYCHGGYALLEGNAQTLWVLLSFFSETGKLMARYCIAFDTVKSFSKLKGTESIEELVSSEYIYL